MLLQTLMGDPVVHRLLEAQTGTCALPDEPSRQTGQESHLVQQHEAFLPTGQTLACPLWQITGSSAWNKGLQLMAERPPILHCLHCPQESCLSAKSA